MPPHKKNRGQQTKQQQNSAFSKNARILFTASTLLVLYILSWPSNKELRDNTAHPKQLDDPKATSSKAPSEYELWYGTLYKPSKKKRSQEPVMNEFREKVALF